jgi:hypothetical protein
MDPKTREERLAEFRRLFEADKLEEAQAVLAQIPPVSFEEFKKTLDEAPLDDEPLTQNELAALARAEERRRDRALNQRSG